MRMHPSLRLLPIFLLAAAAFAQTDSPPPSYNRDIRPLLSDACFACHGPDKANRKADLRLDQPGHIQAPEFLKRLSSADPEEVMPPPKAHKKLSAAQIALLQRWVESGAPYEPHWAFLPPRKPPSGSSIDELVSAARSLRGLRASPRADAATLLRRVALDLTGLPPTLEEQQRFASADAYAAMVDHFLAKPAFGEHMAVAWLDAARYADTNGYQVDRDRELWPWRDWVVRAFNANLPFDRFTVCQLAGDLLENPTLDQRIATGFHRNHMLNEEGGVIPEEFLAEYAADRVETTAAVWLGQTFNCARCHDHKYDPFTQRDFYALKAYFHNVPERGVGLYNNPVRTNAPPFLKLPTPEAEAQLHALNTSLKSSEAELKKLSAKDTESWAESLAAALPEWSVLDPLKVSGAKAPLFFEAQTVTVGTQTSRAPALQIRMKSAGAPTAPKRPATVLRIECSTTAPKATVQLSALSVGKAMLRALDPAHAGLSDGTQRRTSLTLEKDVPAELLFELDASFPEGEIALTLSIENSSATTHWRVLLSNEPAEKIAPPSVLAIARLEPAGRSAQQHKLLEEHRLSRLPEHRRLSAQIDDLRKRIAATEADVPTTLVMEEQKDPRPTYVLMRGAYDKPGEQVTPNTPEALPKAAADLPKNRLGLALWLVGGENPLTARVTVNRFWQQLFGNGLVRSSEDFGLQGDLPSHPELLDWLALTFQESGWDVKALLKRILMSETYRQSSRLPKQTDPQATLDPANTWLARGPRHRLPAEVIRDQALAAAGLLVTKMGGPSVKPYHPPGLYEQVVAQRDNPQATYKQGKGEDLYRRSLYTYWKRSVPHPAMLLFDAPFREVCALRRSRSNTPLQALNLLNDPTYVEAARFLAQRALLEGGHSPSTRIPHAFRLLLARPPSARERSRLEASLQRTLADFRTDPEAAQQLLAVGESKPADGLEPAELAAYTLLASTLLNLDETLTKE